MPWLFDSPITNHQSPLSGVTAMNQPRPGNRNGPVAAFFIFVWDAMNFVRRLAFNILFFGLLLVLLVAMASAGRVKPLLDQTTLVVAPEGMLGEQYSIDPAMRALSALSATGVHEVQPRDRLRALDAARTDDRIERVLLRVDRMGFSGYASIREVAAALAQLRAAGKQVVAFGE